MIGVWTGPEQKSFQAVIDGFTEKNPDATVKYTSGGDNIVTVLSTAVEGGNPPDIATVSQPGTMADFVSARRVEAARLRAGRGPGELRRLDRHHRQRRRHALRPALQGGQQVDRLVQRRRPSRTPASRRRTPGTTSSTNAKTINASGLPAYSIGGADGWTLTDLFENIYLRTAGAGDLRQARQARDPVDRPVGQGRAGRDGEGRRRHRQHRRRQGRRPADRLPDLGRERLLEDAEGRRW